jgi:soluble lytic murein transglycosylase
MIKYLLVLLFICTCSQAKVTLKDIESKPRSHARDFLIWQYFKQGVSQKELEYLYEKKVNNKKNPKISSIYLKKTKNKDILYKRKCRRKNKLLQIDDAKCLEYAFSTYKATKLSPQQRDKLSKKIVSRHKKEILAILNEKDLLKNYKKYSPSTIMALFMTCGSKYRYKHLNRYLDKEFLKYISSSWRISSFVYMVVHNDKLDMLQVSLLDMPSKDLNSKTNFFLALNSLRHSDTQNAERFFKLSKSKSKWKIDVDKNNFWLYMITKDDRYQKALLYSLDINIYTLYAREKNKLEFENYFINLETSKKRPKKNICNPYHWCEIKKEIKETKKENLLELCDKYKEKHMLPVQAIIVQKAHNHNMHSYIMPYDKYMKGIDIDTKALIYAIMRQESNMIPSALSRSFALGLMQIMPFVTDDLSKRIDEPIKSYDDMFLPRYNIKYAIKHIAWLQKHLDNPLFIAYAYNGGLGFLKKHLKDGHFKDGEYEPFLSIEMMSNSQSREYGKKVLANYVMYKKIMGEKVSIIQLFDTLTQPKKVAHSQASN